MLNKKTAKMLTAARGALKNSYSPYSGFRVAAAICTHDDEIITGCNIECASYGGTVCAERVAIWIAVSRGHRKFKDVLVLSEGNTPWTPCGFCRQVLIEFLSPKTTIHCVSLSGKIRRYSLEQLLPKAFTPKSLKSKKGLKGKL